MIRHPDILDIARREGKVTVEALAQHFGVTLQTIRRDLTELADAGQLERVHGGAVLPSGIVNIAYAERRNLNRASKSAIAQDCAALIPNGVSLFLNIGTTTEAVARELLAHKDLLVVTNNMNVAQILSENDNCDVIVTGGTLRPADGGLVGELAAGAVSQFRFDLAVIGCSALSEDGDMLDFDMREVSVSRTALRQARQSYLVADASKFQRHAPMRIASLADVDHFFTDAPPVPDLARNCTSWDTNVTVSRPQTRSDP